MERNKTNNQNTKPTQEKLWTIKLLLIGGLIIAFTFIIAIELGSAVLTLCWLLSFGVTLAGFIIGFIELKRNNRALIGVIGNLVLLLLFIFLVLSSLKAPEIPLP
ncbi:MAG: putative membrane protein [Crocinitomicaceae bacterium]